MKLIALLFAQIIKHRKDYALLTFKQKMHTYCIIYVYFKTLEIKLLYFQASLKDPWFIPHYAPAHSPSNLPLAGWLFWYAGCTTECLICPITEYDIPFFDKQKTIKDKQGNLYMATTTNKDIISQHKACLRNRGHPKANFNRFANTVTYYD